MGHCLVKNFLMASLDNMLSVHKKTLIPLTLDPDVENSPDLIIFSLTSP